jgi:hypothetical protein
MSDSAAILDDQASATNTLRATAPPQSYSLATLMLIVTLVSIICGITSLAPGLGVVMWIVAVPALVRTAIVRRHRLASFRTEGLSNPIFDFAASCGVVLVAALCTSIGSPINGFAFGLIGSFVAAFVTQSAMEVGMWIGLVAGYFSGLFIAYILTTNPDPNWGAFPIASATRWERGIMASSIVLSVTAVLTFLLVA